MNKSEFIYKWERNINSEYIMPDFYSFLNNNILIGFDELESKNTLTKTYSKGKDLYEVIIKKGVNKSYYDTIKNYDLKKGILFYEDKLVQKIKKEELIIEPYFVSYFDKGSYLLTELNISKLKYYNLTECFIDLNIFEHFKTNVFRFKNYENLKDKFIIKKKGDIIFEREDLDNYLDINRFIENKHNLKFYKIKE